MDYMYIKVSSSWLIIYIIQHTVGADCLGNGSSKKKSTHLLEWL